MNGLIRFGALLIGGGMIAYALWTGALLIRVGAFPLWPGIVGLFGVAMVAQALRTP